MTTRATLGWLATAGLLLVMVWADGVWTGGRAVLSGRPTAMPDTPPLLAAPAAAVARFEWIRGDDRLTLVRSATGWRDATGHAWPTVVVDAMLESLGSLHPSAVIAGEAVDLAQFGLAPAAERIVVADTSGDALLAMDIGGRNPAWTGYYARRDGHDEVLLVGSLLRRELDKLRLARSDAVPP